MCRCWPQSLRYIPLSLSSSIFSSVRVCPAARAGTSACAPLTAARSQVLVFNAIVARLWLKERVQVTPPHPCADLRADSARSQAVDIVCYLLIMAGISLDAAYSPGPRRGNAR